MMRTSLDPERRRLLRSIFDPSSLDEVSEAVAVATEYEKHVYVERLDNSYRWSLTDPGGCIPCYESRRGFPG